MSQQWKITWCNRSGLRDLHLVSYFPIWHSPSPVSRPPQRVFSYPLHFTALTFLFNNTPVQGSWLEFQTTYLTAAKVLAGKECKRLHSWQAGRLVAAVATSTSSKPGSILWSHSNMQAMLIAIQKHKRLQWAKEHSNWSIEHWRKVLWTDESKFQLCGTNRHQYVRCRPGKGYEACLVPTVKHGGGSLMVWGSFGNNQVGDLVRVHGILEKNQYHRILWRNAIPSSKRLIGQGFNV